ncbi:MAG: hypothetical protein M1368_00010 [Thaumarchaeota archaeon]|nr:hypothetical protein [Nitrososphaerota archaeon]
MSAEEGIQITLQANDEFSEAFSSAQESLGEFSNSISDFTSSESELTSSSNEVSDSMSSMSEQFNATTSDMSELSSTQSEAIQSTQSLSEAQSQATEATQEMNDAAQSSDSTFSSGMGSIMGVTGAMTMGITSAIGLGDALTRQQEANLRLQNAQDNLTKAQNAYNLAVEKYGPNSMQAQSALLSLQNAQNNLTTAQDRAKLSSEQVDMQMLQMATMTVPMLLSKGPELLAFLTGFGAEEDALTVSQLAQSAASGIASGAMALFDAVMDANPIVLVVVAIAALVAALAYLTDGFKNFGPLENDFNNAWKDLQTVFNDVVSFIKSNVYPVLDDLYKIYIQPIINAIDTIKGIGSTISGGLSSLGKDLGIPGLAQGGIVTQPTLAMIGEEGPEAVLPLSDYNVTAPTGFQSLPQINSATTTNTNSIRTATINIQQSNQISSNVDTNNLAQSLAHQIAQRLTMGY